MEPESKNAEPAFHGAESFHPSHVAEPTGGGMDSVSDA